MVCASMFNGWIIFIVGSSILKFDLPPKMWKKIIAPTRGLHCPNTRAMYTASTRGIYYTDTMAPLPRHEGLCTWPRHEGYVHGLDTRAPLPRQECSITRHDGSIAPTRGLCTWPLHVGSITPTRVLYYPDTMASLHRHMGYVHGLDTKAPLPQHEDFIINMRIPLMVWLIFCLEFHFKTRSGH